MEQLPARRAQSSLDYTVEVRYSPALEPITVIQGHGCASGPVGLFHRDVIGLFHFGIIELFYHDIDELIDMCTYRFKLCMLCELIVEIICCIWLFSGRARPRLLIL